MVLAPTGETNAQRYWRLARECLEILPKVSDPAARSTLIEMAQLWQQLATNEEPWTTTNSGR
jgi:hypothetical protein